MIRPAPSRAEPENGSPKTTVYYDGACPLCSREIDFYRRRAGADEVAWVDVSDCGAERVAPDLSTDDAVTRFHVRTAEGRLVSGGAAFAALWEALPAFRWAGRAGRARPVAWLLDRAYGAFLRLRPSLQRLAAGTKRRG